MGYAGWMPRRARRSLIAAGTLSGLLVAVWYAAFHVPFFQRIDVSVFDGFLGLRYEPHAPHIASRIANLCDPDPYVFLAAIPVAIALLRRRFALALGLTVILIGANDTTRHLKPLLAAPRNTSLHEYWLPGVGSFPSGHATAAMALALCLVLAVPVRLRPYAAAVGGAFAVAVSYSFLALGWHYPSDVLGGFLIATIWTLVAVAGLELYEARRRSTGRERGVAIGATAALTPPVLALFAALSVAGLAVLARPEVVLSYGSAHKWFVAGAAAIGAMGLSLATGVMMTLRR